MGFVDYNRIIKDAIQKIDIKLDFPEYINILLSGGGLSSFYHISILKYLDELIRENKIKTKINKIYGVSGGALMGALYLSGVDINMFSKEYNEIKATKQGVALTDIAREMMVKHIPDDSHIKCSGRLTIFVYEIESYKSHIRRTINTYDSKEELINIVLASCTISYLTHDKYTFDHKGKSYFDGIDIDMKLVNDSDELYEKQNKDINEIIEKPAIRNLMIDLEFLEYKQKLKYTFTDECIDSLLIKSIFDFSAFVEGKDMKTIKFLNPGEIYSGQTLYYKLLVWTMGYMFGMK